MKYWVLIALAMTAPSGAVIAGQDENPFNTGFWGPVVDTSLGPVRGLTIEDVDVFLGIPYAEPPTGDRRWREPEPASLWQGTYDASSFGSACPQLADGIATGSEDCLYLNVFRPHAAPPADEYLPVLFFIHGGAHVTGSSSDYFPDLGFLYDARPIARRGAVVVTVNYRLGPLGFMAHPALGAENGGASGNYGTLDLIEALHWVQDHIERFGGDPTRVMVIGQSAGAYQTCSLLVSPLTVGLFSSAMPLSGFCASISLPMAEARGLQVSDALGCEAASDRAPCLRAVSPERLVETASWALATPNVDGYVLPAHPMRLFRTGQHYRVPTLISTAADEYTTLLGSYTPTGPVTTPVEYLAALSSYFGGFAGPVLGSAAAVLVYVRYPPSAFDSPQAALVSALGEFEYICNSRRGIRGASLAPEGPPLYRLVFDQDLSGISFFADKGAFHGVDLYYGFGHTELFGYAMTADEMALSETVIDLWIRFAETTDPNGFDLPAWAPYQADQDNGLVLSTMPTTAQPIHPDRCPFWGLFYAAIGW